MMTCGLITLFFYNIDYGKQTFYFELGLASIELVPFKERTASLLYITI